MKRAAIAVLIVMLVGCSSGSGTSVDWSHYSPQVKTRIDRAADAGDCAELQREFDVAEAGSASQLRRTGDGNSDLMQYILDRQNDQGCTP